MGYLILCNAKKIALTDSITRAFYVDTETQNVPWRNIGWRIIFAENAIVGNILPAVSKYNSRFRENYASTEILSRLISVSIFIKQSCFRVSKRQFLAVLYTDLSAYILLIFASLLFSQQGTSKHTTSTTFSLSRGRCFHWFSIKGSETI